MRQSENIKRRELTNIMMMTFSVMAASVGIFFLFWILITVFQKGASALQLSFFTELPAPAGMGGGLANAIVGTLFMTFMAACIAVPLGILSGVYLAEFAKGTKAGDFIRFIINLSTGVPSIVVGLFVYTVLVLPFGHFSAWAGAVSLSVIMLPVIAATTDDMLNMVPNALRESALALGTPRWKTIIQIVFREAKSGLITGVLLAVARVSGETAPLLFTAMNSQYWMSSLSEPTANLTVSIYNYAMSPYDDWKALAWGASLLITASVLAVNIITRIIIREKK